MGVLKTVLWILLGYYLLRVIGRLLRPWLLAYARRKTDEFFQQASPNGGGHPSQPAPEGEVTIDKKPAGRPGPAPKVGEYIEYEELD
jgi:hypothetical protein